MTTPTSRVDATRRSRQMLAGLLMLPLSLLPFVAYFGNTAEGRLLWSRVRLTFQAPTLPELSPGALVRADGFLGDEPGKAAVLVYHGIGSGPSGEEGLYTVTPEHFAEQMAVLKAADANVVTASELVELRRKGRVIPPRTVVITFDDARAEAMSWADPVLEDAGFRATMFVIGDKVDDSGAFYAGRDRLEEYARSGRWDLQAHTFGSHVMQDTDAGSLPALTSRRPGESLDGWRARITEDLARGDRVIRELTGRRPVALAYPFGAHGTERTNDPRIERELRRIVQGRYDAAFHQDDQRTVPAVTCGDPETELRRLTVPNVPGTDLLRRIRDMEDRTEVPEHCLPEGRRTVPSNGDPTASTVGERPDAPSTDDRRAALASAVDLGGPDGGPTSGGPVAVPATMLVGATDRATSTGTPAAGGGRPTTPAPTTIVTPPAPTPTTTPVTAPRPTPAPTTTVPVAPPTTRPPATTTTTIARPPTTAPPATTTTVPCTRGNGNGRRPC